MNTQLVDRFLKYVSFDTQSSEESASCPSTRKQFALAEYLRDELTALGLEDVCMDENAYVYATLPANTDKPVPTIGFIAHMAHHLIAAVPTSNRVSSIIMMVRMWFWMLPRILLPVWLLSPN